MTPNLRRIVYAVLFETIGIAISTFGLFAFSNTALSQSAGAAVATTGIALLWNFAFNSIFEGWEARQPAKGRSLARRMVHTLLFEGGLVLLLVPVLAWWLKIPLWQAFLYDFGLLLFFAIYTFAFTAAFDRIFGLPASAR